MPAKPNDKSNINIKKVTGNVIISQDQKGGNTSNGNNGSDSPAKKPLIKRLALWATLILPAIGLLTYLGIKPNDKTLINTVPQNKDSLRNKTQIKSDRDKLLVNATNYKPLNKKEKMFDKKKEENLNPVTIGNVSGDVIISQNQSGGITAHTVNITSEKYQEFSVDKETQVNQNLRKLILNFPNHPQLLILIESGNSMRNKVAIKLESILQQYGAGIFPKGNTSIGFSPDYPITIILNSTNKQYANELLIALKPYIDAEYHFQYTDGFSNEFVKFYINGNPTFDNFGHVTIN